MTVVLNKFVQSFMKFHPKKERATE